MTTLKLKKRPLRRSDFTLTVGDAPDGIGKVAVISSGGHPQFGGEAVMHTAARVPSVEAGQWWFREVLAKKPWKERR